jgi:hypothetical protein
MGRVDVDAMLAELTWPQLREWMAFYQLDPWGGARTDLSAAIVASTIANVWRGRSKAYRVADFVPSFETSKRQTQSEMASILTMAAQAAQAARSAGR